VAEADWVRGDLLGHDVPLHLEALRAAGPDYLTSAFRAAGSMGEGNRVTAITELEPFAGGSTGRKARLSVAYEHPDPTLPEHLFVKLSRDLDDELRDRGRNQMRSEVRFVLLSQIPDFPVAVPRCLFGDFHAESGTGVLISERIAFGEGGIEPHHPKARDWELDDLLAHYDALLSAVARLAGAHRAGRFPADVMAHFEPRRAGARAGDRSPATPDRIRELVDRYADLAARAPQLLPASLRSEAFLALLREQAPRAIEHGDALRAAVQARADDLRAFCHWNANIDNAWFWRDDDGVLACGLLDWGNVGQMSMVTAISSCLTFAEPDFVVEHLDHLLARFSEVFEEAGGGPLDPALLRQQLARHVVSGGLQWPLGAVALLERIVPDLEAVADRFDPRIADHELPRTQLHLLTWSLVLWQAVDPAAVIDELVGSRG
jgi:hypothetical protein